MKRGPHFTENAIIPVTTAGKAPASRGIRILVIRGGALGDFLLTLPVLSALRRQFPGHEIEILANPRIASLAVAGGLADRVSDLESPGLAPFFAPGSSLPGAGAKFFAAFNLMVSYLYDPDRIFQSNVARFSPCKFIAGPHRPDESVNTHAIDQLLKPLESIGIKNPDSTPQLTLSHPGLPRVCKEVNWLAIHPGSGSPQKNWPEPKWTELLKILAQTTNWNFLLIGGEAEGDRCHRLAGGLPPKRCFVAQNLPLVELAAKMNSCTTFIGHDSGITHLAAALGLPGLALWGPTSEVTWRPRSDRIKLLRDNRGLSQLTVESVRNALHVLATSGDQRVSDSSVGLI